MQNQEPTANQEAIERVREMIKDIEIAMLTTVSDDGLVSRPMQSQEAEFDGDLWFLTTTDTAKYNEIQKNPQVNLAYAGKSYVSISGTAEFVDDPAKKKEIWNKIYEQVLNRTADDPSVVLLKVNAETAEYWEGQKPVKMAKEFLKKAVTKESPKESDDELNKTVDLESGDR